nr:MAG TPA: hypothetical protein [Caudoviricetes sp.]
MFYCYYLFYLCKYTNNIRNTKLFGIFFFRLFYGC